MQFDSEGRGLLVERRDLKMFAALLAAVIGWTAWTSRDLAEIGAAQIVNRPSTIPGKFVGRWLMSCFRGENEEWIQVLIIEPSGDAQFIKSGLGWRGRVERLKDKSRIAYLIENADGAESVLFHLRLDESTFDCDPATDDFKLTKEPAGPSPKRYQGQMVRMDSSMPQGNKIIPAKE